MVDPVSEIKTFLDEYWDIFYSPTPTFRREVLSWMFVSLPDSLTQIPNLMGYVGDQEEPRIEAISFARPDQVLRPPSGFATRTFSRVRDGFLL